MHSKRFSFLFDEKYPFYRDNAALAGPPLSDSFIINSSCDYTKL